MYVTVTSTMSLTPMWVTKSEIYEPLWHPTLRMEDLDWIENGNLCRLISK